MSAERRHVPLLRIDSDQVVEIPPEFEMPGEEVIIRKEGDRLILEPAPRPSLTQ